MADTSPGTLAQKLFGDCVQLPIPGSSSSVATPPAAINGFNSTKQTVLQKYQWSPISDAVPVATEASSSSSKAVSKRSVLALYGVQYESPENKQHRIPASVQSLLADLVSDNRNPSKKQKAAVAGSSIQPADNQHLAAENHVTGKQFNHMLKFVYAKDQSYVTIKDADGKQKLSGPFCFVQNILVHQTHVFQSHT